jgi:8-oxo-dGTP diphosphatase
MRHMKARNRHKWGEDDFERPLSKLGLEQADAQTGAIVHGEAIDALYASPALRCRQTLEPLARRLGLLVCAEPLLAQTRLLLSLPLGVENPLLARFQADWPAGGRIVACSHGDTIPAFLDSLQPDAHGLRRPELQGFGGWYRARIEGQAVTIERHEPPAGFPARH